MQKLKNKLITFLLRKDKLVAVPLTWQEDYVRLAADAVKNKAAMATIITEYNNLLQDFFNKNSIKELQDLLTNEEIDYKTTMSKKELADLAYQEFKMTIEKN